MSAAAEPASPLAVNMAGVAHRYPGEPGRALEGVELDVRPGEILALVGPSGSGKSTLLALLDGRLRGWTGTATVLGHALDPRRAPEREVRAYTGFIFQDFALVDRATVRQNVLNGRLGRVPVLASLLSRFSERDHEAVETALHDTGMGDLAEKRADQLSGGQRQRVGIARALAQEPRLLLADEPVSSLDPTRAESILRLLAESARSRGATLIFSTHQPELAMAFAARTVALKAGRVIFDTPSRDMSEAMLAKIYGGERGSVSLRLAG